MTDTKPFAGFVLHTDLVAESDQENALRASVLSSLASYPPASRKREVLWMERAACSEQEQTVFQAVAKQAMSDLPSGQEGYLGAVESGVADGFAYLIFPAIPAISLSQLIVRAKQEQDGIPVAMACYLTMKLCDAASALPAKSKGSFQGRIAPDAVYVNKEGETKWALAKSAWADVSSTNADALFASFAAPEDLRDLPVDERSDVFALGGIMYLLLAGRAPFESDKAPGEGRADEIAERIRNLELTPPSTYNRKIPSELERVVLTALSLDSVDRQASPAALRDSLQAFAYDQGQFFSRKDLAAYVGSVFASSMDQITNAIEATRAALPSPSVPPPSSSDSTSGLGLFDDLPVEVSSPSLVVRNPVNSGEVAAVASHELSAVQDETAAHTASSSTLISPTQSSEMASAQSLTGQANVSNTPKKTQLGVPQAGSPSIPPPLPPSIPPTAAATTAAKADGRKSGPPKPPSSPPLSGEKNLSSSELRAEASKSGSTAPSPKAGVSVDWDDEEMSTQIYDKPDLGLGAMASGGSKGPASISSRPPGASASLGANPTSSVNVPKSTLTGAAAVSSVAALSTPPARPASLSPGASLSPSAALSPMGAPSLPPTAPPSLSVRPPQTSIAPPSLSGITAPPRRSGSKAWSYAALVVAAAALLGVIVVLLTRPREGTLRLRTSPANVEVLVDGQLFAGTSSPFVITGVRSGDHTVQVRKAGFATWSSPVTLRSGQEFDFDTIVLVAEGNEANLANSAVANAQPAQNPTTAAPTTAAPTTAAPTTAAPTTAAPTTAAPTGTEIAANPAAVAAVQPAETVRQNPVATTAVAPSANVASANLGGANIGSATSSRPNTTAGNAAGTASRPAETRVATNTTRPAESRPVAAERNDPPRTAGATGNGTLRVNTRPSSQVYVDGNLIGYTPQMAISLAAGRHSVTFVNTDINVRHTINVDIHSGETVTRVINPLTAE